MRHPVAQTVEWHNLIGSAAQGDTEAAAEVVRQLEPGIRILLARRGAEGAITEVLAELASQLELGEIATLDQLTSCARSIAMRYARKASVPPPGNFADRTFLMPPCTAKERRALKEYYCSQSPVDKICARARISLERFDQLRTAFRTRARAGRLSLL